MTPVVGFLGMRDGYVLSRCISICRQLGIETHYYENHEDITDLCDVLFIFRYKRIIPPDILKKPRLGCIMTHYSDLPKYRGFYPINWAIRNNADEIGITMFYGDSGVDTGDILIQQKISIGVNDTVGEIYARCDYVACDMFYNIIARVLKGTAQRMPQPVVDSRPRGAKELTSKLEGLSQIDSLLDLHNFIRSRTGDGQEPAYIEDNEYRLYFDKTTLVKK